MSEQIDVALGVFDHQLLDSHDRRCGKVDDVELRGLGRRLATGEDDSRRPAGAGGAVAASAGSRPELTRGRTSHIDGWSEVVKIDSAVHPRRGRAKDLRPGAEETTEPGDGSSGPGGE